MKKIKFWIVMAIAAVLVFGSVIMTACGEETPAAHTHELTAVAEKAATCTQDGYEAYWKCDGCGKMFSDENGKNEISAPVAIEATGHSGGTATCTAKAVCAVCGEEYGELAAHVYDREVAEDAYLKSAATCTSPAVYYKSCVCGEKGTETFESGSALAHSFTVLQHDASGHWYKCANCDATDEKQAHSGGTATCTEKAECKECGEEYGELAAHVYDREVVKDEYLKSAATCTSPAVYYKSCVCGANGTETFTSGSALAHSYTVLQHDASGHWYKCANCNATDEKQAHSGGTATCTAKAVCAVCGEEYGEYECAEKCPVCGGCLDMGCEEAACADKCAIEGATEYKYEAEDATFGAGSKGLPKSEYNFDRGPITSVGNLSENAGATVTFEFISDEAGIANLIAAGTLRDKAKVFTDGFDISINGGEPLERASILPASSTGANDWWNSAEVNLGCIELVQGKNTIVFTVPSSDANICFNLDYIKINSTMTVTDVIPDVQTYSIQLNAVTQAERGSTNNNYPKQDSGVIGNINKNVGASLTFEFISAAEGKADLRAFVTSRNLDTLFTDYLDVMVNDGAPIVSEAKIPYTSTNDWKNVFEVKLGEIDIVEGLNTISFTVKSSADIGCNFGYIVLTAQTELYDHVCDSECPECGKCMDVSCEEVDCADKCEHYVSYTYLGSEATTAAGANGLPKQESDREGLLGNMSGNIGASLTFTVEQFTGPVKLYVGVSQRSVELTFADEMDIDINGTPYTVAETVKLSASGDNWFDCVEIEIGEITLDQESNTIKLTVKENSSGFNFGYIKLVAAK